LGRAACHGARLHALQALAFSVDRSGVQPSPDPPTAPALTPPTGEPAAAGGQPSRDVLVVEDDPVVARLVAHLLTRRGYTVRHAPDGIHALAMLEKGDKPAIVVMDVMLPYVSGFELITRIRSTPAWSAVPVIMLTSKAHESDITRAFESGVNDYVVKPFRPEEFVARVRRLLDGTRAA
jgi:DNA-binding response OmpR family regulator